MTKEKLDKLKAAQDEVKRQYKAGEIDEGQYRAFQREIIETESKLKHYEKQLKEVNKENNTFGQKINEVSKKLKNVGEKMTNVGKGMSKKITAPVVGIGAASIASFKKVDNALDTIVTKTGATGKSMEGLEQSFRNVSKTMPSDMQAVGDAIGEINTQFGFTDEKLEKATEQMLKFSEINGQDVTSASIASKNAIEAFGLSANDLDGVLDAVTKTAQNTGVGTDKLFDSVVRGAPQLKSLGLDFAQATEVMGSFEQKGIDSSKALSYMSKAQVTFAKEGKTMEEGLAELTEKMRNSTSETDKLTLASEYFGTKGATFMLDAINRGALDFDDFKGAAENAKGAVTDTFEGTLDPIDNFQIAINNLKLVGADIATALQQTLSPMIEKLVKKLQKFADWFKNLSPPMQEIIVKIGLIAGAIGPLLVVGGKLATGIGTIINVGKKLKTGFNVISGLMAPQAPLLIGIAAVVAAGVLLYKNWDKIKETAGKLKSAISEKWDNIKTKTSETWDNMKTNVSEKWDNIKTKTSETIESVKKGVDDKWEKVKTKTSETWENMKTNTSEKWEKIKTTIDKKGGGIKGVINTAMEGYKTVWRTGFNGLNTITGGKFGDIITNVRDKMSSIKNKIANSKIGQAWDKIWNLKLPKIKLPHFDIKGKFSLKPPQAPKFSVDWYKTGAIFNNPNIIGIGEDGPEAVIPIEKLSSILADTLKKINNKAKVTSTDEVVTQYIVQQEPRRERDIHLHIGTLIADEFGLKQLERKLKNIRINEGTRLGVEAK